MRTAETESPFASRLLVVSDQQRLLPVLSQHYPHIECSGVATYMSAIAELANGPVHGIVGYVDPTFLGLERAIRGLRLAVGDRVPIVLCCAPEGEPSARRALHAGASNYVIYPPDPVELATLLSLAPDDKHTRPALPETNEQELALLGQALAEMTSRPDDVLDRLASLVAVALSAKAATVSVHGLVGTNGCELTESILAEPIMRDDAVVGEICVGAALSRPYGGRDLDKLRHYASVFGHVVHATEQHHQWRKLAMTDDLTQLPNRRYLTKSLNDLLGRASTSRSRVTVCIFDIDNFKSYNDQFGHATGDEILRAIADLLMRHCRAQDVVARYGGDEFVVVFWDAEQPRLAGSEHPDEAMQVMLRFQEAIRQHEFPSLGPQASGHLTISGGLATFPWDATDSESLLRRADEALLEAKRQGKNQIVLVGSQESTHREPPNVQRSEQ